MNKVNASIGAIPALAALLVGFLAYLIKYKKKVNLIAGYDEHAIKDKDGLVRIKMGLLIGLVVLFL